MTTFELPIKHTYVSSWGVWEAIREFMQNGLDEDDRGYPLRVAHNGRNLHIVNTGSDFKAEALIIGHTDKVGDDRMRGQHGEGLNLAMLAGIRSGLAIEIKTKTEKWKPKIEYSRRYQHSVLKVVTSRLSSESPGVDVKIGISWEDWESLSRNFLSLRKMKAEDLFETSHGKILFDPESKGKIYAKGIYVQDLPQLTLGYDLYQVKLDRDRRVVSIYDFQYETARLFAEALNGDPTPEFVSRVYALMKEDALDTRGLSSYTWMLHKGKERIAAEFASEFGEDSIPVEDHRVVDELSHSDIRGVILPEVIRNVLSSTLVTNLSTAREKAKNDTLKQYPLEELPEKERSVLNYSEELLRAALSVATGSLCESLFLSPEFPQVYLSRGFLENVKVVDFRSSSMEGRFVGESGDILIARKALSSQTRTLRVLIHEVSHAIHGRVADHGRISEELWAWVYHHIMKEDR